VTRPLVAIPGYRLRKGRVKLWDAWDAVGMPEQYVEAIRAAGGRPVVVPTHPGDVGTDALDGFDALVLAGGGDVDPSRYGGNDHGEVYGVDPARDDFEMGLVEAALASGVPTLCICRGMQVLNVALGGTLVEHLPDVDGLSPHGVPLGPPVHHEVRLDEGSRIHEAVGKDVVVGTSHHHQGLGRLGQGLEAVGRTEDGLVEAIEHRDGWLVGVQWHPEESAARDTDQAALFHALVEEAASRARSTPAAVD
jgi:putative glutamine amidotransferase